MPRRLWFFYDDVDAPTEVSAFLARFRALNPGWTCTYLHLGHDLIETGLVEPPPVPIELIQQVADWYRLVVVSRYGGVWLDATNVALAGPQR